MNKITIHLILFILIIHSLGQAQDRIIKGKVIDILDNPVTGVNITIKNYTHLATITNHEGTYRIRLPEYAEILIFSIKGKKTEEAIIGEQTVIDIILKDEINSKVRKFGLALNLMLGDSRIASENIVDNPYWTDNQDMGYHGGILLTFQYSNFLAFMVGANLSSYEASFQLENFDNANQEKELLTDKDGDIFYRIIQANVVEKNSIGAIEIPLFVNFSYLNYKRFSLYTNLGTYFSLITHSEYSVEGHANHVGYYPDYHVILYNLEEYGFTNDDVNEGGEWNIQNNFSIAAHVGVGVKMKVSKNLNISFGAGTKFGISDLGYSEAKHINDFITTVGEPGKTTIRIDGLQLNINYIF